MENYDYCPSYGELAVLSEMFEKEVAVRGIKFPCKDEDPDEEARQCCFIDYVSQYIEDQDTDPHINLDMGITTAKSVEEIDWYEVFG
jgi:hypothetical protein